MICMVEKTTPALSKLNNFNQTLTESELCQLIYLCSYLSRFATMASLFDTSKRYLKVK